MFGITIETPRTEEEINSEKQAKRLLDNVLPRLITGRDDHEKLKVILEEPIPADDEVKGIYKETLALISTEDLEDETKAELEEAATKLKTIYSNIE